MLSLSLASAVALPQLSSEAEVLEPFVHSPHCSPHTPPCSGLWLPLGPSQFLSPRHREAGCSQQTPAQPQYLLLAGSFCPTGTNSPYSHLRSPIAQHLRDAHRPPTIPRSLGVTPCSTFPVPRCSPVFPRSPLPPTSPPSPSPSPCQPPPPTHSSVPPQEPGPSPAMLRSPLPVAPVPAAPLSPARPPAAVLWARPGSVPFGPARRGPSRRVPS